ncbi:hypothetical protein DXG01_002517 [Tephrocybe rancida]|nr:hypothetical protein DXG01_002517 [Tephrocybe rancida]
MDTENNTTIDHLSYPTTLDESPAESSTAPSAPERQLLKDRLYIGNLHPTVDEYSLLQIFSKFGKVTKLDYLFHKTGALKGKPRGYAFVEYGSNDEALRALSMAHEKLLRGRKLVVTFAQQAPPEHGGSAYGAKRRGMMEIGRPTTLSLLKTGAGSRNDGTRDKIAMMEAKLRQMESTNPKPASIPGPSNASASTLRPTTTITTLHHTSLPPKPPPQLPEALARRPRLTAKPKTSTPLPSLPLLPPTKVQFQPWTDAHTTMSSATARTSKPKLVGVKIGKPKEKPAPSEKG